MAEHKRFYNVQRPLLKVAALDFDKLGIFDPVGASGDTVGAECLLDRRDGMKTVLENGLHCVLKL